MGSVLRLPTVESTTGCGELLAWQVAEGESVERGTVVAEVGLERTRPVDGETVSGDGVEIAASTGGVLRRTFLEAGESAPPGTPIGIVAAAEEDVGALEATASAEFRSTADADSPAVAEMPGRLVTASNPGEMGGTIEAGSFAWSFDRSEAAGGSETGPTPVDVFLGALASCLSLSVRYQVDKRDAPVDRIEVTTDADPEHGPVERVAATIRFETDADDETLERLVDLGERGCYVSQLLRADLPLDISWERR